MTRSERIKLYVKNYLNYNIVENKLELIDQAIIGNQVYSLVFSKKDQLRTIFCDEVFFAEGNTYHREYSEGLAPQRFNKCPKRILLLSTNTSENAINWRNQLLINFDKKKEDIKNKKELLNLFKTVTSDTPIQTATGQLLKFMYMNNSTGSQIICLKGSKKASYSYKEFNYNDIKNSIDEQNKKIVEHGKNNKDLLNWQAISAMKSPYEKGMYWSVEIIDGLKEYLDIEILSKNTEILKNKHLDEFVKGLKK